MNLKPNGIQLSVTQAKSLCWRYLLICPWHTLSGYEFLMNDDSIVSENDLKFSTFTFSYMIEVAPLSWGMDW